MEGTPLLYTHAEELDNNEQEEVRRVMDFLEIHGHRHIGDKVVTAKVSKGSKSWKLGLSCVETGWTKKITQSG